MRFDKSVIVFDLDGTLIDTMPRLADLAAAVISQHYALPAETARSLYLSTSGLPFHAQLAVIMPGDPRNHAAAADFEARKTDLVAGVTLTSHTLDALAVLHAAGRRLAISSNSRQELVDNFARSGGWTWDVALGWTPDLRKGQPHFQEICRQMHCTRADMLFVGDSLIDAALAEEAGVAFTARLGTFTAEHFRARWPGMSCAIDLDDLVRELGLRCDQIPA